MGLESHFPSSPPLVPYPWGRLLKKNNKRILKKKEGGKVMGGGLTVMFYTK